LIARIILMEHLRHLVLGSYALVTDLVIPRPEPTLAAE
jgi:hypothetical protein